MVGSTDMHEEKSIDTVIQSIYILRGTGQVELFREVVRMRGFGIDQDRVPASQDQR